MIADPWGMLGEKRLSKHCESATETIVAYDHTGATWWKCDCGETTLEEGAYASIKSQQLRNSDSSVSAEADELETAKSENTTYPSKAEVEKEKKKNV